jgi:hypothetical protein
MNILELGKQELYSLCIPECGNWDLIKLALSKPDELKAFSRAPQEDVVWLTVIDYSSVCAPFESLMSQMIEMWVARCPEGDYGYIEFFTEFCAKD